MKTYYAQCLLNGIIIKGNNKEVHSIIRPDGKIITKTKVHKDYKQMNYLSNIPLIRGFVVFIKYLISFVSSLNNSAEVVNEELDNKNKKVSNKLNLYLTDILTLISVVISLLFCFILLILVPSILVYLTNYIINNPMLNSILEGLFRIIIFYILLLLTGKIPKIKKMYMMHGAFHKISQCYEDKKELTIDNIKRYNSYDPKCGLSFLFMSMIISMTIFAIIQITEPGHLNTINRMAYTSMISGIYYEIMLLLNNINKNLFIDKIFQKALVKEPDDETLLIVKNTFDMIIKKGEKNEK